MRHDLSIYAGFGVAYRPVQTHAKKLPFRTAFDGCIIPLYYFDFNGTIFAPQIVQEPAFQSVQKNGF